MLIVLISSVAACSSDTDELVYGVGYLSPQVSVNTVYSDLISGTNGSLSVETLPSPSLTLTSASGVFTRKWESWKNYDVKNALSPGKYRVECAVGSEAGEGFSSPWLNGVGDVEIEDGKISEFPIECRLANSMIKVAYDDTFANRFNGGMLKLHSNGGGFLDYPQREEQPIFVKAGQGVIFVELPVADRKITILAGDYNSLRPCALSGLTLGYLSAAADEPEKIKLSFKGFNDDATVEIPLTDSMLNGKVNELMAYGFVSGERIEVVEGNGPVNPVGVRVEGNDEARVVLSINSASSIFQGISREIDLLSADADVGKLKALGLTITKSSSDIDVDLSGLISSIKFDGNYPQTTFSIYSVGKNGVVANPVSVSVTTEKPLATVIGTPMCIEGSNTAQVEINTDADLIRNCAAEVMDESGRWQITDGVNVRKCDDGNYMVTFDVPAGVEDVKARLLYMGNELVRFDVIRKSPEFNITVDAYALHAVIQVNCKDETYTKYVVDNVCIFANGNQYTVVQRHPAEGRVVVTGLTESTKYSFTASIFSSPRAGDYVSPAVTVVTEACSQLPNSDFEDVDKGIYYKNLPSGGRYSQTIVPIYNLQNYTSYTLDVPKKWSNCNAKTFCTASRTPNTWYMQPSAFIVTDSHSGAYAVKIQSVAWDNNGTPISDYLQEGQPYTAYSKVIPEIAYRASGKLFLGDYQFNSMSGEEKYTNGISFGSRPRALSGFYKYLPSKADIYGRGLVSVELTGLVNGAEVVIGEGMGYLSASGTYKAFSVDIDYRLTNVPAHKLKVMISSSEEVGTIAFESANIKTYSDVVSSTSIGGELWIDELKLSY